MYYETIVISALKEYNQPSPAIQQELRRKRLEALQKYEYVLREIAKEPWFFDDNTAPNAQGMLNDEVLLCFAGESKENRQIVGIATFHDMSYYREGYFGGWVNPNFRQGFKNQKLLRRFILEDILPYAWEKLQLIKILSRVNVNNLPALHFANRMKMRAVGILQADQLIKGALYDSVLLELVNPALTASAEETLSPRTTAPPVAQEEEEDEPEEQQQQQQSGVADDGNAEDWDPDFDLAPTNGTAGAATGKLSGPGRAKSHAGTNASSGRAKRNK